ncbi:MAG: hypothetical protein IJ867_06995 [Clostridia bacterium]|nr:hypothetical protein [Clostridia bacterium]
MESIITNDDRTAMAEVDYIIHHMNERYLNKIPQNVQDFIAILKKKNLKVYVDPHQPLEKQDLKEFTLYFLMILNLKYWCDDARRKDILLMLENNQKKYDDKVNNFFENAQSMQGASSSETSSRPVNKPRQVIVTGTPTFPNKVEAPKPEQEQIVKEEKGNALEDIAKETDAMINTKTEGFLTKLIHKIKSFLIKK